LTVLAVLLSVVLTVASEPHAVAKPVESKPQLPVHGLTGKIDTAKVRKLYMDGEFEEAISILENGRKENHSFNHSDSVFIFKHLGVMYAASYETREKGKYFMYQLLTVEPTARIMDMYASDMIYMIFKNIQDEFASTRHRYESPDSLASVTNKDAPQKSPTLKVDNSKGYATLFWVGATTAVAVAGVGAYLYVVNQPGKTSSTDHPLPKSE
jgi:hypothetical protein